MGFFTNNYKKSNYLFYSSNCLFMIVRGFLAYHGFLVSLLSSLVKREYFVYD